MRGQRDQLFYTGEEFLAADFSAHDRALKREDFCEKLGIDWTARDKLGIDWTTRDLAEALGVHKTSAWRRQQKLLEAGLVEKVAGGKRGRAGRLARYRFRFVGEGE